MTLLLFLLSMCIYNHRLQIPLFVLRMILFLYFDNLHMLFRFLVCLRLFLLFVRSLFLWFDCILDNSLGFLDVDLEDLQEHLEHLVRIRFLFPQLFVLILVFFDLLVYFFRLFLRFYLLFFQVIYNLIDIYKIPIDAMQVNNIWFLSFYHLNQFPRRTRKPTIHYPRNT